MPSSSDLGATKTASTKTKSNSKIHIASNQNLSLNATIKISYCAPIIITAHCCHTPQYDGTSSVHSRCVQGILLHVVHLNSWTKGLTSTKNNKVINGDTVLR